MTRHGWYEWRPDTRDERLDMEDAWILADNVGPMAWRWCDRCDRYEPDVGCPACGEPNA